MKNDMKTKASINLFTVAVFASVVLAFLKIFGVASYSWLVVFAPVIVDLGLAAVFVIFAFAVIFFSKQSSKN